MPYTVQPNERFRKINYYDTLLLTSEEFKVEQSYHSMVHQKHNNMFHGVGVAWGLEVSFAAKVLTIQPGVALVHVPMANLEQGTLDPNATFGPAPMVTREVVITEAIDIDLGLDSGIFTDVDANDFYFLVATPVETTGYDEPYKGGAPVHTIDKVEFSVMPVSTTPVPGEDGQSVVLSKLNITGVAFNQATSTIDITALVLAGSDSAVPERKYSGLNVVEAETHRLTFSSVENAQDSASAALLTGAPGSLEIATNALNVNPATTGGASVVSMDGTLSVTGNISGDGNFSVIGTMASGGDLNVGGSATITGDLTVLGTQTTLNTATMQVEDNVITLNRLDPPSVNPLTTGLSAATYSGLEIHEFNNETGVASWPALVWNNSVKLWKMFDYTGTEMDIGYGAPWDTLSKSGNADGDGETTGHGHNYLSKMRAPATGPNKDVTFTKDLYIDVDGNVGIGTETPANELYVSGSVGVTTDLTVNNSLRIKGGTTLEGVTTVKSNLSLESPLRAVDTGGVLLPDGLKVHNSAITLNHAQSAQNAAIDVDRDGSPKAEILWDETEETWKVSHRDRHTQVFEPTEIATVNQLPKSLAIEKTQAGHGFFPGDAIYLDGAVYKKAKSNFEVTTGLFLVVETPTVNTFYLAQAGYVDFRDQTIIVEVDDGLGNMSESNVFNPGQYYFVSDTTFGRLTEKEPPGISNPLFIADGPNTGYVLPYRPSESSRDTLKDYIDMMIVGVVCPFGMSTRPDGWLVCDGGVYSRVDYSRLFTKIGETFGAGDGINTFNVPDLRDQFIRGWGGNDNERGLGTLQPDALQNHIHNFVGTSGTTDSGLGEETFHHSVVANIGGTAYTAIDSQDAVYTKDLSHTHSFTPSGTISDPVDARTATETRPTNVSLLYCIKY